MSQQLENIDGEALAKAVVEDIKKARAAVMSGLLGLDMSWGAKSPRIKDTSPLVAAMQEKALPLITAWCDEAMTRWLSNPAYTRRAKELFDERFDREVESQLRYNGSRTAERAAEKLIGELQTKLLAEYRFDD